MSRFKDQVVNGEASPILVDRLRGTTTDPTGSTEVEAPARERHTTTVVVCWGFYSFKPPFEQLVDVLPAVEQSNSVGVAGVGVSGTK